jgi:hypothetical protein
MPADFTNDVGLNKRKKLCRELFFLGAHPAGKRVEVVDR